MIFLSCVTYSVLNRRFQFEFETLEGWCDPDKSNKQNLVPLWVGTRGAVRKLQIPVSDYTQEDCFARNNLS